MSGNVEAARLVVTCTCGQRMVVPEGAMGKSGKCAHCGNRITVTAENTKAVTAGSGHPKLPAAPGAARPAGLAAGAPAPAVAPAKTPPPPAGLKPATAVPAFTTTGTQAPEAPASASFADEHQWCMIADDFNPRVVQNATCRRGDSSIPAGLDLRPGAVHLNLRYLSENELRRALVHFLPWLVLGALSPVLIAFGTLAGMVGSVLAFPIGWFAIPFIGLSGAINFGVSVISFLYFLIQYIKGIVALLKHRPFVFVPYGVNLDAEQIAEITPEQPVQVLRLELSHQLLDRAVAKATKGEEEEDSTKAMLKFVKVMVGLVLLPLLPIYFLGRKIVVQLLTLGRGRRYHTLFAFVVGEAIDLEKPSGFLGGLRKKWKERQAKQKRVVFLLNANSEMLDDMQRAIEAALGLSVVRVDDQVARQTFWRPFV